MTPSEPLIDERREPERSRGLPGRGAVAELHARGSQARRVAIRPEPDRPWSRGPSRPPAVGANDPERRDDGTGRTPAAIDRPEHRRHRTGPGRRRRDAGEVCGLGADADDGVDRGGAVLVGSWRSPPPPLPNGVAPSVPTPRSAPSSCATACRLSASGRSPVQTRRCRSPKPAALDPTRSSCTTDEVSAADGGAAPVRCG